MFAQLFLITSLMVTSVTAVEAEVINDFCIESVAPQQKVRFRGTQKLRSSDGRQIYFYSNGICEGFDNDRREFSCQYTIYDRTEVRLLDENGNTVYKGTCTFKSDCQNLNSVRIAGTTYWAY